MYEYGVAVRTVVREGRHASASRRPATPMLRFHVSHADDPDAQLHDRLRRVPLGKMLYPEDIGQAAVFLSSDEARGITGSSLVVDGGYLACAEFNPPD